MSGSFCIGVTDLRCNVLVLYLAETLCKLPTSKLQFNNLGMASSLEAHLLCSMSLRSPRATTMYQNKRMGLKVGDPRRH